MRIASLKSSIVMSFCFFIAAYTASGKIIYVDTDAPGPVYDGASWSTAFEYLQLALAEASSGDQIRVAQGVYKPHEPVVLPPTVPPVSSPPDRTATFQLKNGVLIRGGYAGFGEPAPDMRDIEMYETILSGDLLGNDIDVNEAWDVWREPSYVDNSYHVVTGSGTNSTAELDGFTITGGCANDTVPDGTDNGDVLLTSGAGMCNDSGSPKVANCTFRKNRTWTWYGQIDSENGIDDGSLSLESTYVFLPVTSGAAVFNRDGNPTFQNCTFEDNVCFGADASSAGAGVCNINSNPVLVNCVFRANVVTGFDSEYYGGAMANYNSSPRLRFCTFIDNMAEFSFGGAIYSEESNLTLTNCTFLGNEVGGGNGGAMFVNGGNSTLTDCMFDENKAYSFGGAMCIGDGLATITGCTFTDNVASNGGALYSDFHNSLTLKGCTFVRNMADNYGGAIENSGAWYNDPNSTTLIEDCVFTANSAYMGGGIQNGWNRKNLTVVNCLFTGNAATSAGGGIYNYGCEQVLINCTFAGNSALEGNALASDLLYWQETPSNLEITNCIFWNGENGLLNSGETIVAVTYSDVEGGWPGEGNIDADPMFVEAGYWDANGTPADANDDFWVDGDYHLLEDSPCIDAGDNTAVPATVTTDLDGNFRIRGDIVDMGPYESRAVFFVDIDAGGANDGSSWADAYNYLQDALMMVPSGDEIRIAEGTYKPDQFVLSGRPSLGRMETFQLTNGVAIRGGYAGFGEPDPDARDIDVYKTILSGDLNGDDVEVNDPCDLLTEPSRADNCYHVVTAINLGYYVGPNTILDGFIITGGNADGQDPDWELGMGGGMYISYSSPTVINCNFTENSAHYGGGMDNNSGWPYLINCTFSRNFSNWGGGLSNGARSTLIDCKFIGNVSSYKGGAMACGDASPPMNNCTFIGNRAVIGGAIYGGDSNPKATDSTFTGNSAEKGGVVYNNDSCIRLTNCTLGGNWATEGGVIYDDEGSSVLINCTLTANTATTGGVIYSGDESSDRFTNCTLSGNAATTGGVLYIGNESSIRLTNCVLSGNTGESDGVIYIYDESDIKLTHCTLAANSAENGNTLVCDSYQQQYPSSIEVTNCILWNGGNEISNNDGSTITITYSNVQGGWAGDGNIGAEPLFIEPGYRDACDIWIDGDYRLRAASPCIDSGTDADVYEDIDGVGRPFDFPGVDNNGEQPDFDMGAYEAVTAVEGELLIQPNKVNRNAKSKKIFAVIRLPEPIIAEDIDISELLVLHPGGIEADEQQLLPDKAADEQLRIRAVFDRAELLAATPYNGDVDVTVVGRFISGLYFYGTATVTIK